MLPKKHAQNIQMFQDKPAGSTLAFRDFALICMHTSFSVLILTHFWHFQELIL